MSLVHDFPASGKPSEGMICKRCGVELRLVPVSAPGTKHGRAVVQYRNRFGEWQDARIPCGAS